jgi:HlyD family secretion protein
MNTPVLFTLAEDLTHMELQVKVDEADVGTAKPGQPASFTVSAWPGRQFPANIRRVGMGSTITDNVVTYKTVLEVRNDDLALRPGMTATASIITARRDNVLLVPNAALRFTPPAAGQAEGGGSFVAKLIPRLPAERRRPTASAEAGQQVWVLGGNGGEVKDAQQGPQPVPVQTGVSNGRLTEIIGGQLKPGMAVITEYRETVK